MTEIRADSDELRRLAAQERAAKRYLEGAQDNVDQLLRSVDRRGWDSGAVEREWREARGQVQRVSTYLGESPARLERKAAQLDELSQRPWPGVFAIGTLALGATPAVLLGKPLRGPAVDAARWSADKRATVLETTGRVIDVPVGFAKMDLRDTRADALAKVASGLAGKTLSPEQVGKFVHSPALHRLAIGAVAAEHLVELRDAYRADPDKDRMRAGLGAFARVGAKLAIDLGVGATFAVVVTGGTIAGIAVAAAPLWALGLGAGVLIVGPGLAAATGKKWLDPTGAIEDRAGEGWSLMAKGAYDIVTDPAGALRNLQAVLDLGQAMVRPGYYGQEAYRRYTGYQDLRPQDTDGSLRPPKG